MAGDSSFVVDWLLQSVREAHDGETQLFIEPAHERSIVFHIARYLALHVQASRPTWSVDVEYDRWHRDDIDAAKKQLHGLGGDDRDTDVYPDIIIHRRTGTSAAHNLLVVEVKKEETDGHERDRHKLSVFTRAPFSYQHAVFVVIPKDERPGRHDSRRIEADVGG